MLICYVHYVLCTVLAKIKGVVVVDKIQQSVKLKKKKRIPTGSSEISSSHLWSEKIVLSVNPCMRYLLQKLDPGQIDYGPFKSCGASL